MFQDRLKPSKDNRYHSAHVNLLVSSYKSFTSDHIFVLESNIEEISQEIYYAPFAVMSHGTEIDPIFNYANQCALDLFEMSWEEFITMPSRFSAEIDLQEERDRILKKVSEDGFADDYTGVRISKKGRQFRIRNTTVWNVIYHEKYYGQAAIIREWEHLD